MREACGGEGLAGGWRWWYNGGTNEAIEVLGGSSCAAAAAADHHKVTDASFKSWIIFMVNFVCDPCVLVSEVIV